MAITPPDPRKPSPVVAALVKQHDARTLAAALLARLTADGNAALVTPVAKALTEAGFLDPTPPHPH